MRQSTSDAESSDNALERTSVRPDTHINKVLSFMCQLSGTNGKMVQMIKYRKRMKMNEKEEGGRKRNGDFKHMWRRDFSVS